MAASKFRGEKIAAASLALGLASSCIAALANAQDAGAATDNKAAAPQSPQTPRAAAPETRLFDMLEFDVEGNTVLDEVTIDDAVYPFLGPGRTTADIDAARAALEKAYVDRGYKTVAVTIPRQTVVRGVVHLQVLEGRVGRLKVVGSKYTSIVRLKSQVPSLAEGSVPNFNDVQRELTSVGQQADRSVSPSIQAGVAPGTIDVDLVVNDHLPLHGTVEVNNQYSENTTHLRTIGTVSYDNLFQLGHSLTVSYQAAPENNSDANVVYASYLARFGSSRFSLLIDGFHSESNVSVQGGTDVIGRGQIGEIKGLMTLSSSSTAYQAVSLGVAYKHFNDNTETVTPTENQSFSTPVTYFPFTAGYTAILRGKSYSSEIDLSVNFAVPEFGSPAFPAPPAGTPGPPSLNDNRFKATGQQLYARQNITHTQDLPLGLQGFVRLSAQESDQPQITNEEFTVGGASSVRGYLEAEALGDTGLSGTAELRSPHLIPGPLRSKVQEFRAFVFVDGAKVLIRDAILGQDSHVSLLSVGAGGNLQMFSFLNGSLSWARTLEAGPETPARSYKLLFRVWAAF